MTLHRGLGLRPLNVYAYRSLNSYCRQIFILWAVPSVPSCFILLSSDSSAPVQNDRETVRHQHKIGAEVSGQDTSAPVVWCRSVLVPNCPGAEVSWHPLHHLTQGLISHSYNILPEGLGMELRWSILPNSLAPHTFSLAFVSHILPITIPACPHLQRLLTSQLWRQRNATVNEFINSVNDFCGFILMHSTWTFCVLWKF